MLCDLEAEKSDVIPSVARNLLFAGKADSSLRSE
jgi:hypothetical protein